MPHEDRNLGKGAAIFIALQAVMFVFLMTALHLFVDTEGVFTSSTGWIYEWLTYFGVTGCLIFVLWHSALSKGFWRGFAAAFITIFIAWVAEYLGITYGWVFGPYHYTRVFQPQIFGVPLLICMAWEPILYASYLMTDWLLPCDLSKEKSFAKKLIPIFFMAICGGILTTVWDLMVDPVSVQRGYWIWHEGGPYMSDIFGGVPISNYIGWFSVAFVCHIIYRLFLETAPKTRHSIYLNVYSPLFLYLTLFLAFAGYSLWFIQRLDVLMIGILAMGGILILGFSKLYLTRFAKAGEVLNRFESIDDVGIIRK